MFATSVAENITMGQSGARTAVEAAGRKVCAYADIVVPRWYYWRWMFLYLSSVTGTGNGILLCHAVDALVPVFSHWY